MTIKFTILLIFVLSNKLSFHQEFGYNNELGIAKIPSNLASGYLDGMDWTSIESMPAALSQHFYLFGSLKTSVTH